MKIALLYICTGQYVNFWKDFYESMEAGFLTNAQKEYFVFTDSGELYGERDNDGIHRIYQKNLGWPGNTLFRFQMFHSIRNTLEKFDYIFFMNANVVCLKEVTEEMFLPLDNDLLVVQHPFYWNKEPYEFTYERRRKSSAYIPYTKGKVYICGGVNGGKRAPYLELIKVLDEKISRDYKRGVVARWHDESHLNQYILEYDNYRLLSPSYCYPEGVDIPFEPILMVRDKEKKIKIPHNKQRRQKGMPFAGIRRKIIGMLVK